MEFYRIKQLFYSLLISFLGINGLNAAAGRIPQVTRFAAPAVHIISSAPRIPTSNLQTNPEFARTRRNLYDVSRFVSQKPVQQGVGVQVPKEAEEPKNENQPTSSEPAKETTSAPTQAVEKKPGLRFRLSSRAQRLIEQAQKAQEASSKRPENEKRKQKKLEQSTVIQRPLSGQMSSGQRPSPARGRILEVDRPKAPRPLVPAKKQPSPASRLRGSGTRARIRVHNMSTLTNPEQAKAVILPQEQQPQATTTINTTIVPLQLKTGAISKKLPSAVTFSQSGDKKFTFMHISSRYLKALGQSIVYDDTMGQAYALFSMVAQTRKAITSTKIVPSAQSKNYLASFANAVQVQKGLERINFQNLKNIAQGMGAQYGEVPVSLVTGSSKQMVLTTLGKAHYVITPYERIVAIPLPKKLTIDKNTLPEWLTLAFDIGSSAEQPMLPAAETASRLQERPTFSTMPPATVRSMAALVAASSPQRSKQALRSASLLQPHMPQPQSLAQRYVRGGARERSLQPLQAQTPGQVAPQLLSRMPKLPEMSAQAAERPTQKNQQIRSSNELQPLTPETVIIHGRAEVPATSRGAQKDIAKSTTQDELMLITPPASEVAVIGELLPPAKPEKGGLLKIETKKSEIETAKGPVPAIIEEGRVPEVREEEFPEAIKREKEPKPKLQRAKGPLRIIGPVPPPPPHKFEPGPVKLAELKLSKIKKTQPKPLKLKDPKKPLEVWDGNRILMQMLATLQDQCGLIAKRFKESAIDLKKRIVETLRSTNATINNFVRLRKTNLKPDLVKRARETLKQSIPLFQGLKKIIGQV